VYAFLSSLGKAFVISTDTLYFLSKGLTFRNISELDTVMCVTIMLLEVPTGIIADRYGRKISLVFSVTMRGIGYALVARGAGFTAMVAAYVFFGIGSALQSGAINAWLVDAMNEKEKSKIQSAMARLSSFSQIGNAGGALLGGFAFTASINLPWYCGLLSMVGALIVLCTTRESFVNKPAHINWHGNITAATYRVRQEVRSVWDNYLSNSTLMAILLYSSVGTIALVGIFMMWQPWFVGLLGPGRKEMIGFIWMCFAIANLIANKVVDSTHNLTDSRRLTMASLIAGLPLIGFALAGSLWVALPMYMIHVFGEAFKEPIVIGILHDQANGERRATIESYHSLLTSIAEAFGFLIMGFLIDAQGMKLVACECAAIYVIAGIFANGLGKNSINGMPRPIVEDT